MAIELQIFFGFDELKDYGIVLWWDSTLDLLGSEVGGCGSVEGLFCEVAALGVPQK